MQQSLRIIVTCEHGGNRVPAAYAPAFTRCGRVLNSHRGWDAGALELARRIARDARVPLFSATITRLLVDLNRSLTHPGLLSRYSPVLAEKEHQAFLDRYYHSYRKRVENAIAAELALHAGVVHVSVHSFTPVLRGKVRQADIGLLYDPARPQEKRFCALWRRLLAGSRPDLRVRMNYPYLGVSDGFTTELRRRFGERYLGIELEVNQCWPRRRAPRWPQLQRDLSISLAGAIAALSKSD